MFHVYVLRSESTGRRYTGACEDLDRRLREHNSGQTKSTRHRGPWRLIHFEQFESWAEACRRERFFKTGRGRDELERLLRVAQRR